MIQFYIVDTQEDISLCKIIDVGHNSNAGCTLYLITDFNGKAFHTSTFYSVEDGYKGYMAYLSLPTLIGDFCILDKYGYYTYITRVGFVTGLFNGKYGIR